MPEAVVDSPSRIEVRQECVPLAADQALRLHVWDGAGRPPIDGRRRTFVFLNGLESHSLWASELAAGLAERGHRFIGLDRRGSGLNRQLSGSHRDWIEDVFRVGEIDPSHQGEQRVHLIGQCLGARVAVLAAAEQPDLFEALALISPALVMRADLTMTEKFLVGLGKALRLPIRLPSPIRRDHLFTREPEPLEYIANDPARLRRVRAADFYSAHCLLRLIQHTEPPPDLPCCTVFSREDGVVNVEQTLAMLRRLFGNRLTVRVIEAYGHLLLFGASCRQTIRAIVSSMAPG